MRSILNPSAVFSDYIDRVIEPSSRTDRQLLERISKGDEIALSELYGRYSISLYNYLLRLLQDQMAAEDVLQEAFVGFWKGAGDFKNRSTVKTWLFRITHNQAMNWLRQYKPTLLIDGLTIEEESDGPEEKSIDSWQSEQIQQAIEQLRPIHRSVIELSFVYGLSYIEIAEVVGCPVGTVKSRMSYGLQYLDSILRTQDIGW